MADFTVGDSKLLKASAFANNPEKVEELKRKLALGIPLNDEELEIQAYVEEFMSKLSDFWNELYGILSDVVRSIVSTLSSYFENHMSDYSEAATVLTPRQYRLMLNGKPRVRNKWWNEAQRRFAKYAP